MESGEVDGRVVFDRCLQVGRQHGLAMIALRTAHHAGKVEIETQLVAVAQFERRNQQATVIGTGIAGQHRQADFLRPCLPLRRTSGKLEMNWSLIATPSRDSSLPNGGV